MFTMLDKLDEDFSCHTFGCNKQGNLFIDGQQTTINFSKLQDIGINIEKDNSYDKLKEFLINNFQMSLAGKDFKDSLKSKFIKVVKE